MYGFTCNPYDLRCIVGGSSGGEVSQGKIYFLLLDLAYLFQMFCMSYVLLLRSPLNCSLVCHFKHSKTWLFASFKITDLELKKEE